MRTIVHLSDLHFGRVDNKLLEPLIERVKGINPDVIVVSGDLTQRARSQEFSEAREFLNALPSPQVIVPGNHDVPLHNIFQRFLQPLEKYRRYISDDVAPVHIDDEIAVVGVNTARSLTFKDGRINREQLEEVRERLCPLNDDVIKFVVTHHPFDLPENHDGDDLVGRAPMAMELFAVCGVDVLLSGHLHVSNAESTTARYRIKGYSALVVQAGTATSTRGRGENNSFNVIRTGLPLVNIERFTWVPEHSTFEVSSTETFERGADGWSTAAEGVSLQVNR